MVSYQNLESLHLLKLGGAEDEVALAVTCDSLVIGHILPHINTPEGLNYQATKTYPWQLLEGTVMIVFSCQRFETISLFVCSYLFILTSHRTSRGFKCLNWLKSRRT